MRKRKILTLRIPPSRESCAVFSAAARGLLIQRTAAQQFVPEYLLSSAMDALVFVWWSRQTREHLEAGVKI